MKQIKKISIYIIIITILLTSSACSSKQKDDSSEKSVSIADLQECMLTADTTLPEMIVVSSDKEQAELNFSYLSDLSYDIVDSYFYAYAKDGTAEEIAVIKLKDQADVAMMMNSLHNHIKQRKGTFQEYAPEQIEMAEKAVVTREGPFVTFIICSKNGMVQKAFQNSFE